LSQPKPLVINGWSIFAHPLFLNQIESLERQVEAQRRKDSVNYLKKNSAKRLTAIFKLAFEVIPQDPTLSEYRQGSTLGAHHKHWFRAKFFQQYRLFFRFHSESRIIVYAWVNDETSKRAYSSKTDAYRVFERMLASGRPPNDWNALLAQAKAESAKLAKKIPE
jgi:toxin YhaV